MKEGEKKKPVKLGWWVWLLFPGVVGVWRLAWWAVENKLCFATWGERGTFGDSFGAVNSLFSGLAFAGLIVAILLQRKELQAQREELGVAIEEQRLQRGQMEVQSKVFSKQLFENTFFSLLRTLNEIVEAIHTHDMGYADPIIVSGRDCFVTFVNEVERRYRGYSPGVREEKGLPELLKTAYAEFHAEKQNEIGHFFRMLYHIVKFVDSSNIEDKEFYTKIVRAQLSSHQLALLFYNGLSDEGAGFKRLITKYALLKHLDSGLCIDPFYLTLYSDEAYGGSEY